MNSLTERFSRIFPWLLLIPVLLPVIIWNGLIYPYLVPKTLLFYTLSFLSLAVFLILVAYGKAFHWSRLVRRETWIPAALLVLAYIASIFGIDFYRSFWSLFIRGDGLLMLTCAVASFYFILLSADRRFFDSLLRGVTIVSTFIAVYGIGEWVLGGGRIGSLLGNAAFFAGYLGISFFATLIAALYLPPAWRTATRWGAALQFLAIVLTATRGTMLAFALAAAIYLCYLAYRGEGKAKRFSRYALAILALGAVLFIAFRSELARVPFGPVQRLASINLNDADIANRLFIWKNMMGEIASHPILGIGAEHIDIPFNQFYDPSQVTEDWFDRSHNAFIDYAVQYGIGGLVLYVLLIGAFFVAARRFWKKNERAIGGLIALLALTYAAQNIFVFDTISSFWLLLALLSIFLAASDNSGTETLAVPGWMRAASWAASVVLILLLYPVSVRPAQSAYNLAQGYKYALTDVSRQISYLRNGYALGTYGDIEYGYEAYDMYVNYQQNYLTGAAKAAAYQEAISVLTQNFNRYPYDARTALYLARVLAEVPAGVQAQPDLLSATLARVLQESPKRAQAWYILANLSISQANENPPGSSARLAGYTAAEDIMNRYIAMVPILSEPHYVLAQLLYASGHSAEAAAEAAKGKQYYAGDLLTAERAASYYESVLDLPNAQYFLEEILRSDPTNTAAEQDLAKVKAYEQQQ